MIQSHLSYCTLTWGSCAKSYVAVLNRLQKKANTIVLTVNRLTHTTPLFYKLRRLKIYDIYLLQLSSFVFCCLSNRTYSATFLDYLEFNNMLHNHNTPSRECYFATSCIVILQELILDLHILELRVLNIGIHRHCRHGTLHQSLHYRVTLNLFMSNDLLD